jgi:hypothetical protein
LYIILETLDLTYTGLSGTISPGNRIVKTRKKRVAVVRRVEWEIVKILALKGL